MGERGIENIVIQGKTIIAPNIARRFEETLGWPASYWLNLEKLYRQMSVHLK